MKISFRDIRKTFGRVIANDGVTLDVPGGHIQGLLGENGAGKSTLMKILSGYLRPDSGEIRLDGRTATFRHPADAVRAGIGMLHQDPLDFPTLTVLDNYMAGRPEAFFPSRSAAARRLRELAGTFGFSIDPRAYLDTLTFGERQQLEILRLFSVGVRTLILDEPTTGISALQKSQLFDTLRRLCAEGRTVLFVSHKLEEAEMLCHRIAVLRGGGLAGTLEPPFAAADMVALMFGRPVARPAREPVPPGPPVLELRGLAAADERLRLGPLDLDVRAGEVLGLAGLAGSGQRLLLRACAGLARPASGSVGVDGRDLTGRTHLAFRHQGVAYVPAARLEEGLIGDMSLTEHQLLVRPPGGLFIDWRSARSRAERQIQDFAIRGRPDSLLRELSGGNQQRALLSLLSPPLRLILIEEPTRGLDVESAAAVWARLQAHCRAGAAIMFLSSDLDEVRTQSDRILVCFSGRISAPFPAAFTDPEELGRRIGGKGWDAEAAG
jgi:simple sugar transport system ATP-binding protein